MSTPQWIHTSRTTPSILTKQSFETRRFSNLASSTGLSGRGCRNFLSFSNLSIGRFLVVECIYETYMYHLLTVNIRKRQNKYSLYQPRDREKSRFCRCAIQSLTVVLHNVALPKHFKIQCATISFDIHCYSLKIQGLVVPVLLVALKSNSLQ